MNQPGDEIVREFLVESYENLDQLDLDFVALERDPARVRCCRASSAPFTPSRARADSSAFIVSRRWRTPAKAC